MMSSFFKNDRERFLLFLSFLLFLTNQFNLKYISNGLTVTSVGVVCYYLITVPSLAALWRSAVLSFVLMLFGLGLLMSFNPLFLSIISFFLLLASAITSVTLYLFPIPLLPAVPGKYKDIGTISFLLPMAVGEPIPVQCWFPLNSESTDLSTSKSLLWTSGMPNDEIEELLLLLDALSEYSKMPKFLSRHLLLSRTNSSWQPTFENLLRTNNKFPVAIYSHGMYGWRQIHSSCCEILASYGCLVFSCDHAPDAMISRPPAHLKASINFDYYLPKDFNTEQERKFYGIGLARRVQDLRSLISFLTTEEIAEQFPELRNKIDLNRINCWGHSFGGATVTAYCCQYPTIAKAVNLDSWLFPVPDEIQEYGIRGTATLFLSAELWRFGKFQVPFRRNILKNSKLQGSIFDLVIRGSGHQNYCEMHYLASKSVLTFFAMLPDVHDPNHFLHCINQIIAIFFMTSHSLNEFSKEVTIKNTRDTTRSFLSYLRTNQTEGLFLYRLEDSLERFILSYIEHERDVFSDVE